MTLDAGQRKTAARDLARRLFQEVQKTANLNLDDLAAAVGSVDDTMDALPTALAAAQTVKANFVQRLPEPFKSNTNAQEKAIVLMVWAMKEVGII